MLSSAATLAQLGGAYSGLNLPPAAGSLLGTDEFFIVRDNTLLTGLISNILSGGLTSVVTIPISNDHTGNTDTANVINAYIQACNSHVTIPGNSSATGTVIINFLAGGYWINQSAAMMSPGPTSAPTPNVKVIGIVYQGAGSGLTTITYTPSAAGPMFQNQRWLSPRIRGINFIGNPDGGGNYSDFWWSQEQAGQTNIQNLGCSDVSFNGGAFNNYFRLTGGNNNSENFWLECGISIPSASATGFEGAFLYTPPAITATISASNSVAIPNAGGTVQTGDTGSFGAAVAYSGGTIAANTQLYVVTSSATAMQLALTYGGTPITFTASATPNFSVASDQFLNHWFDRFKFDSGNSIGSWVNLSYGGHVTIDDSDSSGRTPASVSYMFQLLTGPTGTHNGGVMAFEATNLRIEHGNTNSRCMHSQWTGGGITWINRDESSQAGRWPITNQYDLYEIINNKGPIVSCLGGSQLMGCWGIDNNTNNFNFQNSFDFEGATLLENPSAYNFLVINSAGSNSGGYPRARFNKCRNTLTASSVGYHEIVDCDLFWQYSCGGIILPKVASFVSSNSNWPVSGGSFCIQLPMNVLVTSLTFYNPTGSSASGAYQYTFFSGVTSPVILAGGVGSGLAGANSATAIPASSAIVIPINFETTTDDNRKFTITDTLPRSGVMTGIRCLVAYTG